MKSAERKTSGAKKPVAEMDEPSHLHAFFMNQVKDIYWAEKHLAKALPRLTKAATSPLLQNTLQEHLRATLIRTDRLEEMFDALGKKPIPTKCAAMEGLVKEAIDSILETENGTMVRDCALIVAAQKAEHYEIASYGSLKAIADILGEKEVAELLNISLSEVKVTDSTFTSIAESFVNAEAEVEE